MTCLPLSVYCQGKQNSIFAKITINELILGYERVMSPNLNLSIEGAYRFSYSDHWRFLGSTWETEYLSKFLCFHGFALRVALLYKVSDHYSVGPLVGYLYRVCDEVINDPEHYNSNPDGKYQVWKQSNNEAVVQCMNQVRIGGKKSLFDFYYALGFKIGDLQQSFSIDGTKRLHTPSTEVRHSSIFTLSYVVGLKIRIIKF